MPRARSFSRNGARYVEVSGHNYMANYLVVRRIVPDNRDIDLVGIDTYVMRFRVY